MTETPEIEGAEIEGNPGRYSEGDSENGRQGRNAGVKAIPGKQGTPGWLKFGCGCGCLVAILVVVLVGIRVGSFAKGLTDPETRWADLREQLYFSERPSDLTLEIESLMTALVFEQMSDSEMYTLVSDSADYRAQVTVTSTADDAEGGLMNRYESQVRIEDYSGDLEDNLNLQGRVVYASSDLEGTTSVVLYSKQSVIVVMIEVTNGSGPPTDAQIQDFFSHFELWR